MSSRPRYRLLSALAVAAVAVAAAACSAPGASSSNGGGTASTGAAAGPIKIAVVDAQSGSESDLGQFEYR
ncbi:MAG: hypothetical protein ACRDNO_32500, partial [Trebonia sp.]